MQTIPITKLIMDDTCKNRSDAYQVAFYKIENFKIEKSICLNIEQNNCNKFRINDLSWLKNQPLLKLPDVLIMRTTTKLTEEETKILCDSNIKICYVDENMLENEEKFNKKIQEIERQIYKSRTLKYFEIERQNVNNIESKYNDGRNDNTKISNDIINEVLEMIREKDEITYSHVRNVSDYVDIFVDGMPESERLNNEQILFLKKACLLHDIGKLTIPNQILRKKGSLDNNEYHNIQKHVSENAYLFNSKVMQDYREIALSHHERYDGLGYPKGLKGNEIPYFARIVAVLDTFEALTGKREYIEKRSLYDVLNIIVSNAGTQFDPKVVEYFIKGIDKNKEFQKNFFVNEGGIAK